MDPTISLGEPIDMLAGLQPCFGRKAAPWRAPPRRPLVTEPVSTPADPIAWEAPTLSLHDTVADLLSGLFDYQVCPMIGLDGPLSLEPGNLMTGAKNNPALLRELGLESNECKGRGFLLARIRATRPAQFYTPEWQGLNRKQKILHWLTPEGRHAMARLRLQDTRREHHERFGDITARQARRYLEYFEDFGTHVVRSVSFGECLYQVFTVTPALLPALRDMFNRETESDRFSGPMAFGMAQFTRAPWVERSGPIMSASCSATARAVVADSLWRDSAPDFVPSLLSYRASIDADRGKLLRRLESRTAVAVSFACQALYMEDFRADAWHRVLRGSLTQQFSGCRRTGWRARSGFQPAAFLASAQISGDAALFRPARPVSSDLVFALNVTDSGRTPGPASLLALFAATEPQTGDAMVMDKSYLVLDPRNFKLPFTDGCIQVATKSGQRATLIEGVWFDSGPNMRPRIAGAPAEPDQATLQRHEPQLQSYVRLMDQMQGPLFSALAQSFMRRCAKWLVDVTDGCPGLAVLQLNALLPARGVGWDDSTLSAFSELPAEALASTLQCALSLLALPTNDGAIGGGLHDLSRQLRALYRAMPVVADISKLKQLADSASNRLATRFEGLSQIAGLPDPLPRVFAAGANLCCAPDPRVLPHHAMPGDHAVANLWNGLLAMRSRYSECRATIAMHEGDATAASRLLQQEPLTACHAAADPIIQFVDSVSQIMDAGAWLAAVDGDLRADMRALERVSHSASLVRRISALAPAAWDGVDAQLSRLLLVLEVLNLSRAAGLPVATLDTLAPRALVACVDQALNACPQRSIHA